MALKGKLKVFADAVFAGKTNKAAAVEAGYSAATASAAGSRLVKDKRVIAYLAERQKAPEQTEPPPEEKATFDLAAAMQHKDPKTFLMAAMNDAALGEKYRIDAAKALMPFMHQKMAEVGKKGEAAEKAKQAAGGKFKPAPTPLKLVNTR